MGKVHYESSRGKLGMQYLNKSFTNYPKDFKAGNVMSDEDRVRLRLEAEEFDKQTKTNPIVASRKKRMVIPFGKRILVRRRKIGDTIGKGGIILTDDIKKETETDIADVVFVTDRTLADNELIKNSPEIIDAQINSARRGNADALETVMRFNEYLKESDIAPGDVVMISKYCGTSFSTSDLTEQLWMVNVSDIMGKVCEVAQ